MKHIFVRILLLFTSFTIAIIIGLSMLNQNRRCGTGDGLAVAFWIFIFYIIWSIYVIVETILLHKKKLIITRNYNIILVSILPIFSFIIWIYFLIIDLF